MISKTYFKRLLENKILNNYGRLILVVVSLLLIGVSYLGYKTISNHQSESGVPIYSFSSQQSSTNNSPSESSNNPSAQSPTQPQDNAQHSTTYNGPTSPTPTFSAPQVDPVWNWVNTYDKGLSSVTNKFSNDVNNINSDWNSCSGGSPCLASSSHCQQLAVDVNYAESIPQIPYSGANSFWLNALSDFSTANLGCLSTNVVSNLYDGTKALGSMESALTTYLQQHN
jgi:hypothetical protein